MRDEHVKGHILTPEQEKLDSTARGLFMVLANRYSETLTNPNIHGYSRDNGLQTVPGISWKEDDVVKTIEATQNVYGGILLYGSAFVMKPDAQGQPVITDRLLYTKSQYSPLDAAPLYSSIEEIFLKLAPLKEADIPPIDEMPIEI